jgi:hypothetical protein
MGALRSLRLRLVAVLTGVVACAMGVVFLYVVPSLRQNLISDRLTRLEAIAHSQQQAHGLVNAFTTGAHVRHALLHTGRLANGQASAYARHGGVLTPVPGGPTPVLPASSGIVRAALRRAAASSLRSGCRTAWCCSRRGSETSTPRRRSWSTGS